MLTTVTVCHPISGFFTILVQKGHLLVQKGHLFVAKGHLFSAKGHLFVAKGHLFSAKGHLFRDPQPPVGREGKGDRK